MKEEGIQYIGAKDITPAERNTLDKISSLNHHKIQRMLKNMTSLVVHIKIYEAAGKGKKEEGKKRRKYAIHIRALAPTRIFTSTKAVDWDLAKALHKSFTDMENIIGKSMRPDEQHPMRIGKATRGRLRA